MRHALGYLVCVAFVALILTELGLFPVVYGHSDAIMRGIVDRLKADPAVGPTVRQAVDFTAAVSRDKSLGQAAYLLGRLFTITFSPVGAIALGLYLVVLWILP